MRQLKNASEVAVVRLKILAAQDYKCAVCGVSLKGKLRGGPTLDHDHDTGLVRGVLCKVCNTFEGKLRVLSIRYGNGKVNELQALRNMVSYRSIHTTPRTEYLYPVIKKRRKRGSVPITGVKGEDKNKTG